MADPSAAIVFDMGMFDNPDRSLWFADLMVQAIEHIDDPDAFSSAVTEMSERHLEEGVTSAHYICFARAWPAAVHDVLGPRASDAVVEAWDEAYWYLAGLLADRKEEIEYRREKRKAA